MKKTKREKKQLLDPNEIAHPDRLFVFKLARRYPDRASYRRFLQVVRKAGCYYNHDTEAKTVTVVFEDRESREVGVRLLKNRLQLLGEI